MSPRSVRETPATDQVLMWAREAVSSPWFYAVLPAAACVDAFFPVVPSESLVITAGVYAATGGPNLAGAVACAAAGAFAGDHAAFWMGRTSRGRLMERLRPGSRRERAFGRASRALRRRGGLVLVVARDVPGGRTAVTMTMGASGCPGRRFAAFAAVAAVSWGSYGALVGYAGGRAFEDDPLRGLAAGLGLAVGITAVEGCRSALTRRRTPSDRCPARRDHDRAIHRKRVNGM